MPEAAPKRLNDPRDTFSSVERAFEIVTLIADSEHDLSLSAVARHLDVNKAIADKLLNSLIKIGLVWRDGVTQTFHLTYRISNLGLKRLQQGRLLDLCSSELRQLANETGELIRLALVERAEAITWVYAAVGQKRALQIAPNYTLEIGLHAHAAGKAWLCTLPFERAWELMLKGGMEEYTPHTLTGRSALKTELREAFDRGFAVSCDESEVGVGAVAAPIWAPTIDGKAECVGSVSLGAPSHRMTREQFIAVGPRVVESADRLGRQWPIDDRIRMNVTTLY